MILCGSWRLAFESPRPLFLARCLIGASSLPRLIPSTSPISTPILIFPRHQILGLMATFGLISVPILVTAGGPPTPSPAFSHDRSCSPRAVRKASRRPDRCCKGACSFSAATKSIQQPRRRTTKPSLRRLLLMRTIGRPGFASGRTASSSRCRAITTGTMI